MAQPEYLDDNVTDNSLFGSVFTGALNDRSYGKKDNIDIDPSNYINSINNYFSQVVQSKFPYLQNGKTKISLCRAIIWDNLEDTINRIWRYLFGARVSTITSANSKGLLNLKSSGLNSNELVSINKSRLFSKTQLLSVSVAANIIELTIPLTDTPLTNLLTEESINKLDNVFSVQVTLTPTTFIDFPLYDTSISFSQNQSSDLKVINSLTVTFTGTTEFPVGSYNINVLGIINPCQIH